MFKLLAGLLACVLISIFPSDAFAIKGLPGDTWGLTTQYLGNKSFSGISAFVSQGVDWFDLPLGITFNTFVEYRYKYRTKEKIYFDASGTAVGIDFKKSAFHLRTDYYWEKMPGLNTFTQNRQTYLTWYYDWYTYMKQRSEKNRIKVQAITGYTWGKINHDYDGRTGTSISGFVNEGIDWFDLPGKITFNTFVEYRFNGRTMDKYYYDSNGPAIGLEFKKDIFKFGMDYFWEHYREQNVTDRTWRLYLTWYYYWDLMHK